MFKQVENMMQTNNESVMSTVLMNVNYKRKQGSFMKILNKSIVKPTVEYKWDDILNSSEQINRKVIYFIYKKYNNKISEFN